MEGTADDQNIIKSHIGGDGDVKDGDSSPDHHRQNGRISEEVYARTSSSSTADADLEGEVEEDYYLEVHHQFPGGGGGGAESASADGIHGHILMMKKSREITAEEEEEKGEAEPTSAGDDDAIRTASKYYYGELHYYYGNNNSSNNAKRSSTTTSEIVVVGDQDQDQGEAEGEGEGEGSSQFSFDFHNHHHLQGNLSSSYHHHNHSREEEGEENEDAVYVAVSSSSASSSMDALLWTLDHAILHPSSTTVFLVHVFPQVKHIPTPLGMLAVSQVNPEQKEKHMAQERGKRREFLNEFLNACSTAEVKVDTVLIESDKEAKAILDLISILNITKLILGTTKANLRKMRPRKGSAGVLAVVDEIVKGAPEFCEVKIICEAKEVIDLFADSPSPQPLSGRSTQPPPQSSSSSTQPHIITQQHSFGCGGCFKPKFRSYA